MLLASWWSPWPYGENVAGVKVIGPEVCSCFLKLFSQEARPERTGDLSRFLQSFKVHHDPFEKRDTGTMVGGYPFSHIWSLTEFRDLELRARLVEDFLLPWRPGKGSRLRTGAWLLWNWRTSELFSVWLFTTVFPLTDSSCPPQDHTEMTKSACRSSESSQINKSILFKFVVSAPCWFIAKLKGTQSRTINQ